jgi:hypothetical protein
LLNKQHHKQHHAHAPFQAPLDQASPPSEKDPSTDGPKEPTSTKDQPLPQFPTLKLLNNQPPNAAHATLAPTLQPQLPKEPDITILLEASPLLSPSNGQSQETPLPNQLERHRDNLPKKSATCPTTTQSNQVANALPYALEHPSEQCELAVEILNLINSYLTLAYNLTFSIVIAKIHHFDLIFFRYRRLVYSNYMNLIHSHVFLLFY